MFTKHYKRDYKSRIYTSEVFDMAGFVDNEKYASREDDDQSLSEDMDFDDLFDETDDEEIDQLTDQNRSISRRRIEDYMELRRMRNELDDPFFDFD